MTPTHTRQALRLSPSAVAAIAAVLLMSAAGAAAQTSMPSPSERLVSPGFRFTESTGEALYKNVCQACHMPDAKGATGAGTYPSLAGDKALEAGGYAIHCVVKGRHAMPPVGVMMTDDQVAAVVNYVRTHFGNDYHDAVTAADVGAVRR